MASVQLSYLINTRNKLPYLRLVMERLLKSVKPDEEVVVVDGGSVDGTREYLRKLHCGGLIHQFLSEPDKGEAHGWNKGLLMSRGELIKIITDDDAFHYPSIRACREFLLAHPEVDLLATDGSGASWGIAEPFRRTHWRKEFEQWLVRSYPFTFCGLGLMLRRHSLSLVGLFNTSFRRVDCEFTWRATAGPVNLAWYTGCVWVRLVNPRSQTAKDPARITDEGEMLANFYLRLSSKHSPLGEFARASVGMAKLCLRSVRALRRPKQGSALFPEEWGSVFERADQWLAAEYRKNSGEFIYKNNLSTFLDVPTSSGQECPE